LTGLEFKICEGGNCEHNVRKHRKTDNISHIYQYALGYAIELD